MRKLLSVIIVYLVGWIPMFPCTSAVVSGRVTPDGRPLLWKHRDASDLNNRIVHFEAEGGKLEFVGLVNGVDTMANEVWAGYNTSGFAIMNTASYNLKNDTSSLSDREGVVMKQVLGECRTVEDFARLLDSLPRPIGVEANFGVVDALGGAAYFEVNSYEVFRYDVKDSPDGYLLRTNYSVSGRPNEGYGYIRYDNAARLFSRAASEQYYSRMDYRRLFPLVLSHFVGTGFYDRCMGGRSGFHTSPQYIGFCCHRRRETRRVSCIHYHVDDIGVSSLFGRVAGVDRLRVWCSDPVAGGGRFCALSVVRMVEPIEKQSVFFGKRQRPALSAYGIAL